MAVRPGEDLAATLFADIHYYYGPPTVKPPHHRFDKGSYVYLFENAGQRRARLEIANNAGTSDQDAFTGHLDSAHVKYSYKHTTLVTLTIDGPNGQQRNSPIGAQEWHLPTFDPRNETKYMYRLHTIDLYFWNKEDALNFVNGVRRVLPQHQITIEDEPAPPPSHADDMSPIVQQLENVAILDPSYHHGRTKTSRTSPPAAINVSFPGPPNPPSQPSQAPATFAPMAYNPAAPAAPEAIQHREKTPPPEDGAGNPLVHAATSDHGQFSPLSQFQQHQGFSTPAPPPQLQRQQTFPMMSPPQQSAHGQGNFAGVTPPQHTITPPNSNYVPGSVQPTSGLRSPFSQQFAIQTPSFAPPPTANSPNTFAPPPTDHTPPLPTPTGPSPPAYSSPPISPNQPTTQYATFPSTPSYATHNLPTPGLFSPGFAPQHQNPPLSSPAPGLQPLSPPGGFSNYTYTGTQNSAGQPLMSPNDYSIHQQVYRPTEIEAKFKRKGSGKGKKGDDKKDGKDKGPRGRLEDNAGRLEKGVTGILKKFEKKYG
ncbi:uncharacterized protein EAF01_011111 [Botrytis porri]|uniref:Uncharacterized protein n=1 Tax=Botrytis porri TaxID=87229 RepID=A0A4Z1KFT2_9HELO|nr:uncharacterized protein EAF01_011111 [Botrytis porri]KAF7887957.1 hypothetical protein EAF01_011111 [Botrytis porri]TGO84891.1 hypothetical protein BPOR_0453g00010 [Botrytis porri]